jgi:hypothetical protein
MLVAESDSTLRRMLKRFHFELYPAQSCGTLLAQLAASTRSWSGKRGLGQVKKGPG